MSDSQSSGEHQIKVEQKMEARLRDLLQKGKTITPFYDDDTLLLIYKDCYHNDQVFINKLQIIAKNHKSTEEEGDKDWIQFKQHQKTKVQRTNHSQPDVKRQKYHFLDDKELIERAKKTDIERQRQIWQRRKNQQYRERQQNRTRGNQQGKSKYQEKSEVQEKVVQPQQEKKPKYKEKIDQKSSNVPKIEETKAQQITKKPTQTVKNEQNNVTTQQTNKKPVQSKKVQQSAPVASQQANKKIVQNNKVEQAPIATQQTAKPAVKYTEKKEQKPIQEVKNVPVKNQTVQSKVAPIQKPAQNSQKASTQQIKKQTKVQYRPKQQQKKSNSQNGEVKYVEVKIKKPQKAIESPKKVGSQKQLEEVVAKQFEESCKQNSYILKFIKPTDKLQKVSYIRGVNGSYIDVKTRQVLPARN